MRCLSIWKSRILKWKDGVKFLSQYFVQFVRMKLFINNKPNPWIMSTEKFHSSHNGKIIWCSLSLSLNFRNFAKRKTEILNAMGEARRWKIYIIPTIYIMMWPIKYNFERIFNVKNNWNSDWLTIDGILFDKNILKSICIYLINKHTFMTEIAKEL